MEEEVYDFENAKVFRLEVKVSNGDIIVIEGNQVIDMPGVIEKRFENRDEFIIFGYMGVRRDLIEWYRITEVMDNN